MTPEQLKLIAPNCPDAEKWSSCIRQAANEFAIEEGRDMAAFVATLSHESLDFTHLEENLNYSAQRLMQVWPRRFPDIDSANACAHNPQSLAEKVYGGRMGNEPGTGQAFKFRGRGPIQITGRVNYAACSKALYSDQTLLDDPDLLLTPEDGSRSSGWFWAHMGLSEISDFKKVTLMVNGGTVGYADRLARFNNALRVLGA